MAPEIIQGLNQSFGIDWWSFGILIYEMIYGVLPFNDGPIMKMYEKILTLPIQFPTKPNNVSNDCKRIISSFLKKTQQRRLGSGPFGASDVKSHPWFKAKCIYLLNVTCTVFALVYKSDLCVICI